MGSDTQISNLRDAVFSEAFISGRRAGLAGLPPSISEGSPGTPEHEQWIAGWRSGNDQRAYADAMLANA